ncbi:hypothetical protein NQ315_006797 [Exocentrus adspersus]|uniref:Uncharacterized protein n=1 Tax=Exocentrus adspersus TaxID=1586481 RepID=A0AAV8WDA9_9CUCU|nr:hypothetical protein NQ315_006797 [Exocentrus adspersus]
MEGNNSQIYHTVDIDNQNEEQRQTKNTDEGITSLLDLLEQLGGRAKRISDPDVVQSLRKFVYILVKNPELLTYQHCKNKKVRSILHIAKYSSGINCDIKQAIVNTIVDIGYNRYTNLNLFPWSNDGERCYALFFAAAKADYKLLKEIIEYFKNQDVTYIHDTREGDTVLHFMIKFGDHFKERFLDCIELILNENVDPKRLDYFKKSVAELISKELVFLEKNNVRHDYKIRLEQMYDIINNRVAPTAGRNQVINPLPYNKYKLFEAIITQDENFSKYLKQVKYLLNSNDGENTLLQLAIIKNDKKITKELLRNGIDPNTVVEGRNEEPPLVLAAKLAREEIFQEILKCNGLTITEDIFAKFVKELKWKFLNDLLQSNVLDVNIQYKGNTPMYYAITRKNKKAVQSLLQRGSPIDDVCLQNINPKDLEDYLNWCIKFDTFAEDVEESKYKSLLVFDSLINAARKRIKHESGVDQHESGIDKHASGVDKLDSGVDKHESGVGKHDSGVDKHESGVDKHESGVDNFDESTRLQEDKVASSDKCEYDSEIAVIRQIGNNKRLKHLLEHPLIYIFVILKWQSVIHYYYLFVVLKFMYYIGISSLLYTGRFNNCIVFPIILLQAAVVYYNYTEFKFEFKRYTLHFVLEILLFVFLVSIFVLKFANNTADIIIELSSFIIIFTSVSMLMTIGYHIKLSKWMAMAKRVFKNFTLLLLFFMIPIIAFSASFKLLLTIQPTEGPVQENREFTSTIQPTEGSVQENGEFNNLPRAMFRTLVMLGGDIGDKKFPTVGGYLVFVLFTVGMAIILLNFWTGVAVSDIKEIEEKSTIVAFKNVIVFIDSVERMYQLLAECKLSRCETCKKLFEKIPPPFLRSKVELTGRKKCSFSYGIDLYINSPNQFKHNRYFKNYRLPNGIILKIKSLSDEKDLNIGRTLNQLVERINKLEQMLENRAKLSNIG